jgi:aminoglycoside phosphotransferase (APT) family kinase protein
MIQLLDALPADRRDAAAQALTSAFGRAPLTAMTPILGGASGAQAFRVEIGGKAFVLRLDRLDRHLMRDPARHYAAMTAAASAGLAPALHHADPDAAVAIMDFIEARPMTEFPGGRDALARELGGFFARLQATEPFASLATAERMIGGIWAHIGRSGVFADGLTDPHLAAFARLHEAYPWEALPAVSSHNDPNFRNVLFDGRRLWLIDWETAYLNDPLFDLAIVSKELEAEGATLNALLNAWQGGPPTPGLLARVTLMRHISRLYYAGLLFSGFAASPNADPIDDLTAPSPDDIRTAVAEGRMAMASPALMQAVGKLMLAGFLEGANHPETLQAMARARDDL